MLISEKTEDGTPVTDLTPGSCKKVQLRCDDCGIVSTVSWSNYQQALRLHRRPQGETYCRPCGKKVAGKKRLGSKAPAVAAANARRRRDRHASWRGGRYVDREGYVMILVVSGLPADGQSGWTKYRKEHRVVMEKMLGRRLRPGEIVHHIDNDKQNNSEENLLLLSTQSEHRILHFSMLAAVLRADPSVKRPTAAIGWRLFAEGKIKFDRVTKTYCGAP